MTESSSQTIPNVQQFLGNKGLGFLNKRSANYPHKIFSLADTHMPCKLNELFDLCHYFFHTSSLVHPVLYKMSEYPVTKFAYDGGDKRDQERTKNLLEKHWRMRQQLITAGLYYHGFGNCFAMAIGVCKRYIQCPRCSTYYQMQFFQYRWRDFKPYGRCLSPHCKYDGPFMFRETMPIHEKYMRLIMLDPREVEISYNKLTGSRTYIYKIPPDVKRRIRRGDPYILEDTPKVFIDAVKQNRNVVIDDLSLFHFHRPGLTPSNDGYGMPLIVPVLQDLYYQKTLRRAQEAISLQHIVPLMVLFPQQTGSVQPAVQYNLSDWRARVETEFKKWKKDPNHIPIMPVPLGVELVGGNARALMITPELEQVNSVIINGMLAPREIVEGGLSWSGSSISLRMVENHFINYRNDIQDFLTFATDKAFSRLGWKPVEVTLEAFRMADDVQRLQLMMSAGDAGVISQGKMLSEMDLDFDEEHKKRMGEMEKNREFSISQAQQQATAEAAGGLIMARSQVEQQMEQQKAMQEAQAKAVSEDTGIPLKDPHEVASMMAYLIAHAPAELQQQAMQALQEMPTFGQMVQQHLAALHGDPAAQQEIESETGPLPMTDEEGEPIEGEEGGAAGQGGGPAGGGGPANSQMNTGQPIAPLPEQHPTRQAGRL